MGPGHGTGDEGASEGSTGQGGVNERMQQAIRDALGAGDRGSSAVSRSASQDSERERRDGIPSEQPQPPEPDQDSRPARSDSPPDRDLANAVERDAGPGPGAPSAGSGSTGSAGTLLGQAAVDRAATGTQSLSIKLGAQTALAPSQHEPQRQSPPVGAPAAAAPPQNGQAPALADEQLPVAALQKADVAAEHEAIVRRIFTRDE